MATRQTKKAPVSKVAVREDYSSTSAEEVDAMKAQVKFQMDLLLKSAAKLGVEISDLYPTPPKEVTKVVEATTAVLPEVGGPAPVEDAGKLKPGTVLPGGNWVRWGKDDLNPA